MIGSIPLVVMVLGCGYPAPRLLDSDAGQVDAMLADAESDAGMRPVAASSYVLRRITGDCAAMELEIENERTGQRHVYSSTQPCEELDLEPSEDAVHAQDLIAHQVAGQLGLSSTLGPVVVALDGDCMGMEAVIRVPDHGGRVRAYLADPCERFDLDQAPEMLAGEILGHYRHRDASGPYALDSLVVHGGYARFEIRSQLDGMRYRADVVAPSEIVDFFASDSEEPFVGHLIAAQVAREMGLDVARFPWYVVSIAAGGDEARARLFNAASGSTTTVTVAPDDPVLSTFGDPGAPSDPPRLGQELALKGGLLLGADVYEGCSVTVTPTTYQAVVEQAQAGQTVCFEPGTYGRLSITSKQDVSLVAPRGRVDFVASVETSKELPLEAVLRVDASERLLLSGLRIVNEQQLDLEGLNAGDPWKAVSRALQIRNSPGVLVADSLVRSHAGQTVLVYQSDVTVVDSALRGYFHVLRATDQSRLLVDSVRVTVHDELVDDRNSAISTGYSDHTYHDTIFEMVTARALFEGTNNDDFTADPLHRVNVVGDTSVVYDVDPALPEDRPGWLANYPTMNGLWVNVQGAFPPGLRNFYNLPFSQPAGNARDRMLCLHPAGGVQTCTSDTGLPD